LLPGEDARRLVAARIMGAIYRHLLQRIIDRDVDVFSERVRLSAARKAWIALSVWARTMAWPQTVRALRHVK
jgi:phytoene/squalene synthetase